MLLDMTVAATKSPVSRRWTVGLLLVLTCVTGLVDAASFLSLGQVFVANMTGNLTFLGLSLHPDAHIDAITPLSALGGFIAGALIAGRAADRFDRTPRRWLSVAFGIEAFVIALVAALTAVDVLPVAGDGTVVTVMVLAVALGVQNGTVHHLGVPDLTTTVLTLSLAGVVTYSQIAGGRMARPHRRLGSIAVMLAGASAGALLLRVSPSLVLVLAALGVALVAECFARVGREGEQRHGR